MRLAAPARSGVQHLQTVNVNMISGSEVRSCNSNNTGGARRSGSISLVVVLLSLVSARHAMAVDASGSKKIFNQRCTACHTFGRGIKVGPDLKGVAQRRSRPWLLKFVRSSQAMIQAEDPIAIALFQKFNRQRMPDWTDLSDAQIGGILDWLAADGPDQKEPDERHAELASAAEVQWGAGLVQGTVRLTHGGLACATCHRVGTGTGGTLGPDLGSVYSRYQDRALTIFLKKPCSPRMPELLTARYLTPQESFSIKAYLRQATEQKSKPLAAASRPLSNNPKQAASQ